MAPLPDSIGNKRPPEALPLLAWHDGVIAWRVLQSNIHIFGHRYNTDLCFYLCCCSCVSVCVCVCARMRRMQAAGWPQSCPQPLWLVTSGPTCGCASTARGAVQEAPSAVLPTAETPMSARALSVASGNAGDADLRNNRSAAEDALSNGQKAIWGSKGRSRA